MSEPTVRNVETPTQWSGICRAFSDDNIYQTWAFGEISAADTGSEVCRVAICDDAEVIGAAQIRIKRIPFFRAGLAYVYSGPVCESNGCSASRISAVWNAIRKEFAERRGLEVRIIPNGRFAMRDFLKDSFSASGFAHNPTIPCQRTMVVDLSPSEEELRKGLAQKWRNGLNQGERRGVRIESHNDDYAMELFEGLYDAMWSRKQFETGVTVSSFRRLQQLLPPEEKLTIQLAYRDDELTAGHVSSTLGDTCVYLLGASNELGRDVKASYCLQWQAMLTARQAGARRYDLGGVDPLANPGVFHFKAGLGGAEVQFPGGFDARSKGLGRFLVPWAARAYRYFERFSVTRKRKIDQTAQGGEAEQRSEASCPTIAKLSS